MLKSVIFLTASDSLKRDNPPATEDLILVRELKIELENPYLVNMVRHHPYRRMTIEITSGDRLNKMLGQASQ